MSTTEYVKEAVAEDRAENYEKAFELYMTALEYFKTHLKYEKNPKSKEAITAKVRITMSCTPDASSENCTKHASAVQGVFAKSRGHQSLD